MIRWLLRFIFHFYFFILSFLDAWHFFEIYFDFLACWFSFTFSNSRWTDYLFPPFFFALFYVFLHSLLILLPSFLIQFISFCSFSANLFPFWLFSSYFSWISFPIFSLLILSYFTCSSFSSQFFPSFAPLPRYLLLITWLLAPLLISPLLMIVFFYISLYS